MIVQVRIIVTHSHVRDGRSSNTSPGKEIMSLEFRSLVKVQGVESGSHRGSRSRQLIHVTQQLTDERVRTKCMDVVIAWHMQVSLKPKLSFYEHDIAG